MIGMVEMEGMRAVTLVHEEIQMWDELYTRIINTCVYNIYNWV